jgi:CheY-like chemotaxis protein
MNDSDSRRILIVEDEGLVAMLLEDMLIELGHSVIGVVGTIEKAAESIAKGGFDLAILDVNLNGRHTDALAETLRQQGVPFMFATGYGAGLSKQGESLVILPKPFSASQLQEALAKVMQRQPGP